MVHWPLKHRANCNFSQLFIGSLVGFGVLTAIMVMPLVGIGDSYFYYDVNGFCAFSLVTDCSPIHLVLIALIGSLLSLSVIIIICCNAAMLLTLRRRSKWLVKHGSSKTNSNQKAAKENPHAAAFQKLTVAIALINLILVLPFTVSYTHVSSTYYCGRDCFVQLKRGAGMMNYKNIDRISLFILYRPWKATVVCFNLV